MRKNFNDQNMVSHNIAKSDFILHKLKSRVSLQNLNSIGHDHKKECKPGPKLQEIGNMDKEQQVILSN
jgi:hypothetical protein